MKKFLIIISLFLVSFSFPENEKYRIKVADYGYTFIPMQLNSIIWGRLDDERLLKIKVKDYKGEMHLQCFSKDSTLLEEGNYINSLDLLASYQYTVNGISLKERIDVVKYYQPLRDGVWNFYHSNGSVFLKKQYNRGILIDSTVLLK